jgi:hypothetical protein
MHPSSLLDIFGTNASLWGVRVRRLGAMPLYMDHHKNLQGLTAQAVAAEAVHREAHGNVAETR